MDNDGTLFEYAAKKAAKGIAQAEHGAGEESIAEAVAATLEVGNMLGEFTSEDVRALKGDFGFIEPRAWGAVMKKAAATGFIRATDRYAKTGRASSHNRPMRLWKWIGER